MPANRHILGLLLVLFHMGTAFTQGFQDYYYDLDGNKHVGKINIDHGYQQITYKANKETKRVRLENNEILSLVVKGDSIIVAASVKTEPKVASLTFTLTVVVSGRIEVVYEDYRSVGSEPKSASSVPIPVVGFNKTIAYYVRKGGAGPFYRVRTKEEWSRFVQMVADHPYYGPYFEKNRFRQLDGVPSIARRYNREMAIPHEPVLNSDGF